MTVKRVVGQNGSTHDTIVLSDSEIVELDRCHEIIRRRFEEKGHLYTDEHRKLCEWWLQGILRFDGVEKMVSMAESAPFHEPGRLVAIGYAEKKEVGCDA